MDNLVRILRSFSEGKEDKTFTENFVDLLKDKVMTDVQRMYELGLKFKENKVFFHLLGSPSMQV